MRFGWSQKMQRWAITASRLAGWDNEHRYLVMRHCGCTVDPKTDQPSLKHPDNTAKQFAMFMSYAEPVAKSRGKKLFPPKEHDSWAACVNDESARMRHRIRGLCDEAVREMPELFDQGMVDRVVRHCAKHDTVGFLPALPERLEQCDMPTLIRVYECLRAWVGREFAKANKKPRTFKIPNIALMRAKKERAAERKRAESRSCCT